MQTESEAILKLLDNIGPNISLPCMKVVFTNTVHGKLRAQIRKAIYSMAPGSSHSFCYKYVMPKTIRGKDIIKV